jgi:peptidoglycan hydrolase-like protein with peptidoglycan-binding domain
MFKKALFVSISTVILTVPFAAPLISGATTITDLQAQLQSLLSQIQALQSQSSTTVSGSSSVSVVASAPMPPCLAFSRSLWVGVQGSDVTALQQFLISQGDLDVSATGYFGALTKAAVGTWQSQNGIAASGSAGFGIFGPLSRAHIQQSCGTTAITTPSSPGFYADPMSGTAPLTVQFSSSAPQGTSVGTTVNFGDGTTGTLGVIPTCSSCNARGVVSHTYASVGTYNVTLTGGSCTCPTNGVCNCPNMQILGTATVTVTATGSTSTASSIQQLNAPASVSLSSGGIAEVRNESYYFTLENLTSSSATIQLTPVGCWNSFPSDTPPQIRCMLAVLPIAPQTLSVGQTYAAGNYAITLIQIANSSASFSVNTPTAGQ